MSHRKSAVALTKELFIAGDVQKYQCQAHPSSSAVHADPGFTQASSRMKHDPFKKECIRAPVCKPPPGGQYDPTNEPTHPEDRKIATIMSNWTMEASSRVRAVLRVAPRAVLRDVQGNFSRWYVDDGSKAIKSKLGRSWVTIDCSVGTNVRLTPEATWEAAWDGRSPPAPGPTSKPPDEVATLGALAKLPHLVRTTATTPGEIIPLSLSPGVSSDFRVRCHGPSRQTDCYSNHTHCPTVTRL